ncbi:hypothetical protein [Gordonia iterans]|uniref:hypothetical protein n=1 Tax=Gordonia iterans TaxID=1004901 RepID=UPI00131E6F9D|nr:hypothetical protein [Gordonia iterans]
MTHLHGAPTPLPPQPAGPGPTAATKILLGIVAVLVVAIIAVVAAIVIDRGDDKPSPDPVATQISDAAPSPGEQHADDPSADAPTAPVAGAYPGAGGARPDGATPLRTYTKSGVTHAHLLTPTGGIGCDFSTPNEYTGQGQCGVRSMSGPDSPLGCVNRSGTCKGKWLFQFKDDRVGDPVDSSGTTGWMNQPANDGYQVPRVEYGKQYYFDDWAIASEENGLTVWNSTTGSGVFLSREKAERFDGPGRGTETAARGDDQKIVLGSAVSNSRGFGTVQPREIHSGGSGSSTYAYDLTWRDWGGDRATATGLGYYAPPGAPRANAPIEEDVPITVVAFEPSMCNGQRAYTKVAYFFPGKSETFESARVLNACWER